MQGIPLTYPVNMFQTDVFNFMCGFDSNLDGCHYVLDENMSQDLLGFCKQPYSEKFMCFSFKRGLVYYSNEDTVFRARLICQVPELQPSTQMDNVFLYGLSFMDAFNILGTEGGTKTVLRNIFLGFNEGRDNIADMCGIAELEQYPSAWPVCNKEITGPCTNHQTMFPFCLCTTHAHGCAMEPAHRSISNKIRVIIPLMEPLLRPEAHKVDTSPDAELMKCVFEAWEKKSLDGKELEMLNIIFMRVK